ncbi:MAG TPA: HlyD family efflux transporter periplasmic adaptor subunit [Pyrinomonadaceae bacterium]|nr:HlyD family efflux transporter periplasmic adaptor subunit [Pyrinomonadaceae bacterium]
MSTPFSRTLRSLAADNFRSRLAGLLVAALVVGAWAAWAVLARVPVYAVTEEARLEAGPEVHYIESPVNGRVVALHVAVGQEIKAGHLLFELDSEDQRLDLHEERTRQSVAAPQISVIERQILDEQEALESERQAAAAALSEARARLSEVTEAARFAAEEVKRMSGLYKEGFISEVEFLRLESEAKKRQAVAESSRLALDRLAWEGRTKENNRRAHIESLKREVAALEGNVATSAATGRRLEHEVGKHLIRAAVSGRVGELSSLRVGTIVQSGGRLGAIIPRGELKAVGYFPPDAALGRIRAGQPAEMRLQGFPWTEYGSLKMVVASVSNEARDGRIRVEFKLSEPVNRTIPLEHGLPGAIEVDVDRVSPAVLVLRAVGKGPESPEAAPAVGQKADGQ